MFIDFLEEISEASNHYRSERPSASSESGNFISDIYVYLVFSYVKEAGGTTMMRMRTLVAPKEVMTGNPKD